MAGALPWFPTTRRAHATTRREAVELQDDVRTRLQICKAAFTLCPFSWPVDDASELRAHQSRTGRLMRYRMARRCHALVS